MILGGRAAQSKGKKTEIEAELRTQTINNRTGVAGAVLQTPP